MSTSTPLPRIESSIACDAHYPLLLDGEAVVCNRPAGHEGDHEHRSMFGDVCSFEDQPECWTDVPSKLVIVLRASTTDRPDWADVRGVLENYLPADDRLLVAPLSATIRVASRGLVGTITVSGARS